MIANARKTLPRYLVVGASAVLVNLVLFECLTTGLGWPVGWSSITIFLLIKPFAYFAHHRFTFQLQEQLRSRRFIWFALQQTALLSLNTALMVVLVDYWHLRPALASLLLSASLFAVNYACSLWLTFNPRRLKAETIETRGF